MSSFKLHDSFIEPFKTKPVEFGFEDAGGAFIGEIVYLRTYSRKKPCEHGNVGDECACPKLKEHWWETCRRVVEGTFSLEKTYVKENRLPWNYAKSQRLAQDMYERMFDLKWTPPGRGLAQMGSELVMNGRDSASLNNCGFTSTADMTREDPTSPYTFLMEASMLGIGIGFDLLGAKKNFPIYRPSGEPETFVVPDTREGWVELFKLHLESFLKPDKRPIVADVSLVRPEGAPVKGMGGLASGPAPLLKLLNDTDALLTPKVGQTLTATDIADICNMIGVCIKQGNVRRSAQLMVGDINNDDFLDFKNYNSEVGRRRSDWAHLSNNSVDVNVGDDLSKIVPGIALNGEPGVLWMDTVRQYGRLKDPKDNKDYRVSGLNPCAEQPLESGELCTLCNVNLERHDSIEDFKKTLKVAYLYAKTVTLIPTRWPKTNAIMQRNRRIGTALSGIANFVDHRGLPTLRVWMDEGYQELRRLDRSYSEWLCVRESIRVSTVKPDGSIGKLLGVSPGVHWTPGGEYFMQTMRMDRNDALTASLELANYRIEDDVTDPSGSTVVAYFPVHSQAKRSEREVTIFEKAALAATAQELWSDNAVSVTLSFDPETEGKHVGPILNMYQGKLKTVSFLPMLPEGAYPQMPYGRLSKEEYEEYTMKLMPVDLGPIYAGLGKEAIGEAGCSTDACEVRTFTLNATTEEEN